MTIFVAVSEDLLFDVMRLWGLELGRIRQDMAIHGSPERSEYRVVVESAKGDLFLLEQVYSHTVDRKKEIARCLDHLVENGLEMVIPYRKNRRGERVLPFAGKFWQIQDFLPGVELDRSSYVFDGWRGKAAADFLIRFKESSQAINQYEGKVFSVKKYIYRLVQDIQTHDPAYVGRVQPVFDFLEKKFFSVSDHRQI